MLLSVLALSSRFDGHRPNRLASPGILLSVLALSSRFDGRLDARTNARVRSPFQYSLCRVVLMVDAADF